MLSPQHQRQENGCGRDGLAVVKHGRGPAQRGRMDDDMPEELDEEVDEVVSDEDDGEFKSFGK